MPAQPWNVVVAATTDIAEQYRDAFNLGMEVWDAYGIGAAVCGRGYFHIVIIRPHWEQTGAEIARFEEMVQNWRCRLAAPHGTIKII